MVTVDHLSSPSAGRPNQPLAEYRTLWGCLLLLFGTLAVFWPVTGHDFVNYDDRAYVTENLVVQEGLSWENIGWAAQSTEASNWYPLTWVSHLLDCRF